MKLNNKLLNSNINAILKELINKGITLYRISKDTGIPNSSLKYMLNNRFEWKLNHLYSLVSYLKQYNSRISIDFLLNNQPHYLTDITSKTEDSSFLSFELGKDIELKTVNLAKNITGGKKKTKKQMDLNIQSPGFSEETDLINCLYNVIKNSPVTDNHKVIVDLKILGSEHEVLEELKLTIGKFKKTPANKK